MQKTAIAMVTRLGTVLAVLLTLPQAFGHNFIRRGEPSTFTYKRNFTMPGVTPKEGPPHAVVWLLRRTVAHGVCEGSRIMYAWAKNAPSTVLPKGVGFHIGGKTGIRFSTLQIHYAKPLPDGVADHSGLQMELTEQQQKYKAGIYLLAAGNIDIPPHTEKTHADMNCMIGNSGEPKDIYLFAYRVHAYDLGTTKEYTEIAKGNPHWPQAFYPMHDIHHIRTSDILHARCTWNSTTRNRHTFIGSTSGDEMCNLYLMYYTDREQGSEMGGCGYETFPHITHNLPVDSDVPLPPNPLLEEHAHGENKHDEKAYSYGNVGGESIELEKKAHSRKDPRPGYFENIAELDYDTQYDRLPHKVLPPYRQRFGGNRIIPSLQLPEDTQEPVIDQTPRKSKQLKSSAYRLVNNWGQKEVKYGQVVAVALDSHGDVVVFHRGNQTWDGSTFVGNTLKNKKKTIAEPALLHLDKDTGHILHKWGENYFFMPHGLTLDKDDNIWVTDVGLHQVLKFPAGYGEGQPLLTLGTRTHFCKPTGIAVLNNGEFFVSDGYCNARVIKYSADGKFLFQFGERSVGSIGSYLGNPDPGTFNIPHALALAEDKGELCVADRENGRVQCFTIEQGKFTRQFQYDAWGGRVFSLSYTPAFGGKLFTVNGPQMFGLQKLSVFEVSFTSRELQGAFSPNNQGLSQPHDVVASVDGFDVYVAEIGPNKLWKFELDEAAPPTTTQKPGLLDRIFNIFSFMLF
ncbi:Peptidyl-glycine alpha-amidating monooxygenase-like [Homarus americanus]|uniref:Peptidyl-glycine alpha-amidating monooxygenase-like n=1 Tax=Homarus americanus TaxID=6706 RepID=A0A8J5K280_HOMAM|nr:Peptidyl-glycine alpha-amidating monooxygenase-like [Homarus americanus]